MCNKLRSESPAIIPKSSVFAVARNAYTRALSPENVQFGFRKSGVCPLNPEATRLPFILTQHQGKRIHIMMLQNSDNEEDNRTENTIVKWFSSVVR